MWALLSSRVRTWVLLAVAVPLVRALVHRFAGRAAANNPQGKPATVLAKADSALTRFSRRRRR